MPRELDGSVQRIDLTLVPKSGSRSELWRRRRGSYGNQLQQTFCEMPLQAREVPPQLLLVQPTISAAEAMVARRVVAKTVNCILEG
jgi:hypothetical protein